MGVLGLVEAEQFVASRDQTPALADADRELLGDTLRSLRRVIGDRGAAEQLLHGEPHPGNMLTTGVEVEARPPGKKVKRLSLLSGGERSLTALAFLFALQAVNPSPFYVLDEVDAALDDANVVRFNRVLKRLSADQQFLIVTHNHSTMAQAEVLYGVTLGEHGISRIVSVRLHQDALVPVGERSA